MEQTMNRTKPIGTAFLVGLLLLVPTVSRAQDLREEIEAIVKDYLASHPDEVGRIVQGYFVQHPEAFGQILAESLNAALRRQRVWVEAQQQILARTSKEQL